MVARGLRRIGTAVERRTRLAVAVTRRAAAPTIGTGRVESPTGLGRVIAMPWYPWLAAVIPILHFLASNPLHFAVREVGVPIGAALLFVSACVVVLRLVFKDWHRPSAATAAVTVLTFGYGHVERALDARLDERVLFGATVVLAGAMVAAVATHGGLAARSTQYLNPVTLLLLVFPTLTLAGRVVASNLPTKSTEVAILQNLTAHLPHLDLADAERRRPDIYYIIVDAYSRHDALGDFDNSAFLREMESRGFYVAAEAVSNYDSSIKSITSRP